MTTVTSGTTRLLTAVRAHRDATATAGVSNEDLLWGKVLAYLHWRRDLNSAREILRRDGIDWTRATLRISSDARDTFPPAQAILQAEDDLAHLERVTAKSLDELVALLERRVWHGFAPRALRLAQRERLSVKQTLLLCTVIAACTEVGIVETGVLSGELRPAELHDLLDLHPQELLALFWRSHFLQRLDVVRLDDSNAWRRAEIVPNRQVAAILRGLEVEDGALVALAPGAIRDLLAEEPAMRERFEQIAPVPWDGSDKGSSDPAESATPVSGSLEEVLARLRSSIAEEALDLDAEPPQGEVELPESSHPTVVAPLASDFEYVQRHMDYFRARIKLRVLEESDEDDLMRRIGGSDAVNRAAMIRSLRATADSALANLRQRIRLSAAAGLKLRGEVLASEFGISDIEKQILLATVIVEMVPSFRALSIGHHRSLSSLDVGTALRLFFDTDEEQVRARRLFDASAPLVRFGLINVAVRNFIGGDLLTADIHVDKTVAEFVVGLDGVGREVVAGSHLIHPEETLERVVMNEADKAFVVDLCRHHTDYVRAMRKCGAVDPSRYGNGPILVFYGPPGTGKTLMARAIANALGVPLLLSNSPMVSEEALRAIFRVAAMHRAVVFFDEADGVGRARTMGGDPTAFVSEIERQDLICILATNRPQDLDDAVSDRVIKIPFYLPDPEQRARIFELHVPPGVPLAEGVDLKRIAWSAELSGRRIKGAAMIAASRAIARNRDNPVLSTEDLEEGVRRQVSGRLSSAMLEGRRLPRRGLARFVADADVLRAANEVIGMARTRRTLDQWFRDESGGRRGIIVLLEGPSGCGKTLLAEVVAYELGIPIQEVRASDLVSKWVGETTKQLTGVLGGASGGDVLLAMDECEALLGGRTAIGNSTDRYANLDVNTLLQIFDRFPGILVLTTNLMENLDPAFYRRLDAVIRFSRPGPAERERLWRLHLPTSLPQDPGVDPARLAALGNHTGGLIWKAVRRAAVRAAMRQDPGLRLVTMDDLSQAADDELAVSPGRAIGFT